MALADEVVVQPDVVYVAADRRDRLAERGVDEAPTLVAEVLLPSTAYLDVSRKRRAYEEAGVEERWALDPAERSAEVLTATDDGLRTTARVYESGAVASGALAGFAVDAADLFLRP